jgi:hypothetical protein
MKRMRPNPSSRTFPLDVIDTSAMYTLYIFDQSRSITAIPSAGYLGSYNGYVFGMYEPQPYTPLPSMHYSDNAKRSQHLCHMQQCTTYTFTKGNLVEFGLSGCRGVGRIEGHCTVAMAANAVLCMTPVLYGRKSCIILRMNGIMTVLFCLLYICGNDEI